MLVHEFLDKNKIVIMSQPPDLVPADFFLFPKLKTPMKEKCYDYDLGDKRKIETEAVSEERFRSVSRIGKNADISVLYLRAVTLKGTR